MDPLITAEELTKFVGFSIDPDLAALAIAAASGIVRDHCGWSISIEQTTFVVDGNGSIVASLPTLRLIGVDAVRLNGVALTLADPLAGPFIPSTACTWSAVGQLFRAAGWPVRARCIEADVVHGFDVTPDTVRAVTLRMGALWMSNPQNYASRTVGGVTLTHDNRRTETFNDFDLAQLSGYRL
jgi:hypothetical protein